MIINPYLTSFGSMINVKSIKESLIKYLIEADINLNYEYIDGDECKIVFITGRNEDEKELPIFEHPIVFENHRGIKIVATDLRKYLKIDGDFLNLGNVVNDKGGFEFMLLRTLIISDMESDLYGAFKTLEKSIVSGYAKWLTDSISAVVMLDPGEKVELEVIVSHFCNMLLVNGSVDSAAIETSKIKIAKSKLSLAINIKTVGEIVNRLKHDVTSIDDLVDNIKIGLKSPKTSMIDVNTMVNMVSNSWYGPGAAESVLIAIENMPTWIAMMYSSGSNKSYKRSRLATILEKNNRKIGLKEFNKGIELYLLEKKYV